MGEMKLPADGASGRPAFGEYRGWKETLAGFIFPRRCPVCGGIVLPRGELICPGCVKKLSPVRQPVCMTCGKQLEGGMAEQCGDCMRHPKSFRRNFALLNYNDAARYSMAAVKYRNKREYLDFYGRAVCSRFGRQILRISPDVLVPVPIHSSRMRSRGYNQAELLAGRVGEQLGIPVCPGALRRLKKTLPQKELDPAQRLKNLQQAFAAGQLPEGVKTAMLVDDIYTTGSTLEACARILLSMGVKEVYGLTICIGRGA